MEERALFVIIGCATAFFAVFFLAQPVVERVQKQRNMTKARQQIVAQSGLFTSLVRNGLFWCKPLARWCIKNKHIKKSIEQGTENLQAKGLVTTTVNLCSLCIGVLLGAFVVFCIIGGSALFAGIAVIGAIVFACAFLAREKEKQAREMRDSIPDALRSMSVCFGAGFSLLQTFHQVAEETEEPLRSLFLQAVNELQTGQTASDALAVFRKADIEELAFIAVALDIQHKVGGSIQQVLDTARESVENEIELSRSLKVQTAQAKMSARVVSIMPLILIALFSFISHDFLAPFFQSFLGILLLCIAVAMQVGGILLVRKTLKVEVG